MKKQRQKKEVAKVKDKCSSETPAEDGEATTQGGGGDHGCKPNEYWNGTECVLKVGLNKTGQ